MKSFLHSIKYYCWNPIKTVIQWLPIIWKDRQGDDYYIFMILRRKLELTANHIEYMDHYVGCEHDVKRIRLIIKLIDKFINEDYELEHFSYIEYDWNIRFPRDIIKDDTLKYMNLYPTWKRRAINKLTKHNQLIDNYRLSFEIASLRHEKCKYLIFDLMKKDIERWWL